MPDRRPHTILAVSETLAAGGAENALVSLMIELTRRGHRCEVAVLWGPDTLAAPLERAGIVVHRLEIGHRWRVDQAIRGLVRISRRLRPTVLHGQLFFGGFYVALTRPVDPRPARVVTFQNLGYDSYPAVTRWQRVRKRLDALAMRWAIDARIGVSNAAAEHYARHLGLPRPDVIVNGIDVVAIDAITGAARQAGPAGIRARYGIPEGRSAVLCPATLKHEKGHRFLLEAVALLRRRGAAVPYLVLAGAGPMRAEIEALVARLDLDGDVRLAGEVAHTDLLGLAWAADVLVLPSTHEGMPLVVMEALAVGTVVLASRVGGIPEVVSDGDTGLLAPAADPDALADALGRLLNDAVLRRRLEERGRARVHDLCDIRSVAARHERLYDTVVGGRTERGRTP